MVLVFPMWVGPAWTVMSHQLMWISQFSKEWIQMFQSTSGGKRPKNDHKRFYLQIKYVLIIVLKENKSFKIGRVILIFSNVYNSKSRTCKIRNIFRLTIFLNNTRHNGIELSFYEFKVFIVLASYKFNDN